MSEVRIVPDQTVTLTVQIQVNNLAGVLSLFDQVRVYRSTTLDNQGQPNNFTLVDTITLVTDRPIYLYVDSTAPTGSWYRTTYYNSVSLTETAPSTASQGVTSDALSVFSVNQLKTNFLFGIDLTDDAGNPYPDALFAFYLEAAYQLVKDRLDIEIVPKFIDDERHDFIRQDYNKYVWFEVDKIPVISVQEVKLVLPTNQDVITYDLDWVQVFKPSGQIEIIPGSGQLTLGQTGAFLPLVFGGQDYLPNALRIKYTAGFANGEVPADILEAIGMLASYGPLGIAGDLLVGAGIASQSLSIDGLSQTVNTTSSATNSGYGARLVQYGKQLKEIWPILYRKYHPTNVAIV